MIGRLLRGTTMTVEERLHEELVKAMKAREPQIVDALRMAKSRIVERQKAPGFEGPMTDKVALEAISAYVKSLKKAVEEIERGGGKDNPILAKYRFECEYLGGFLPKTLSEDETRALVLATITVRATTMVPAITTAQAPSPARGIRYPALSPDRGTLSLRCRPSLSRPSRLCLRSPIPAAIFRATARTSITHSSWRPRTSLIPAAA